MFTQKYIYICYAKSLQSCLTLCDPIDGSPPSSPVPGILQARILEWVAISFSNAWKWKVKMKLLSRPRLLATPRIAAYQAPPSMGFSRQEYWSGVPLPSLIYIYQIYIYRHIYGNVICNSPKLDTILISFIRWMVKWTVAHPYQKILLCNGKEQTIDTYRMTLHRIILNEKTQPHDSTYVIFLKSQNQRNGKD